MVNKNWVIVEFKNGKIEAWRDYGTGWGSPIYTVLGYVTGGTHNAAVRAARIWSDSGSPQSEIFSR